MYNTWVAVARKTSSSPNQKSKRFEKPFRDKTCYTSRQNACCLTCRNQTENSLQWKTGRHLFRQRGWKSRVSCQLRTGVDNGLGVGRSGGSTQYWQVKHSKNGEENENSRVGKEREGWERTGLNWKTSFNARHSTTLDSEMSQHKIYDYQCNDFKGFSV